MPQMSPLWWLSLLLFSSILLILFLVSHHFIKNPPQWGLPPSSPKLKPLHWKW